MAKNGYNKGDAEAKMTKMTGMVMEGKMHYPSMLDLDEGDLPEVKDWQVGRTYKVMLTIKQVSSSTNSMPMNDTDKGKVHGRFEVVKAESEDNGEDAKEKGNERE